MATDENIARLEERFEALKKLLEERFEAHTREHQLLGDAREQARRGIEYRLEGMNELRAQISSERGRYVERQLFDTAVKDLAALTNRIGVAETRMLTGFVLVWALIPIGLFVARVWMG